MCVFLSQLAANVRLRNLKWRTFWKVFIEFQIFFSSLVCNSQKKKNSQKFDYRWTHNAHNCHSFVLIFFFAFLVYNNLWIYFFSGCCQNTTNNFPVDIKFYGNKFALTKKKLIFREIAQLTHISRLFSSVRFFFNYSLRLFTLAHSH